MGYLHIDNLYKNQEILLFKECYAMEKINGTSAHITWKDNKIIFFSGGEKYNNFIQLFNESFLIEKFNEIAIDEISIYGEAYGRKQQKMKDTYGDNLKFIVFDVKTYDRFISVPEAQQITKQLGLEFVDYVKCSTDLSRLNLERVKFSVQAKRNGIVEDKFREGIVLRPLIEMNRSDGKRIIAKYKNDEFRETKTKRKIIDPKKLEILKETEEIAQEWVTEMRLSHILDKIQAVDITQTKYIIKAMIEDIKREAEKEIVWSKLVEKSIGKRTSIMFKNRLKKELK